MNAIATCPPPDLTRTDPAVVDRHEDWQSFVNEMIRFGVINPSSYQNFDKWMQRVESVLPPAKAS